MELHKKITQTRIQEICDKYIDKPVKDKKPISDTDVASLSCAELVVLYYNTEWLIKRIAGNDINIALENQILLMSLINDRIKDHTSYAIHTDATNLPFLTEDKTVLVYTEKDFANSVARSFNNTYLKEGFQFDAVEISEDKERYWQKLRSAGINTISVDGTKFTIEIKDLIKDKCHYENDEFCRLLILYAQATRLGILKDKIPIFQEAIINKLKENPKIICDTVIKKGENKFIPLYVNASAKNDDQDASNMKTQDFFAVCNKIFHNQDITGIVLNPMREHIIIPRINILSQINNFQKTIIPASNEKQIQTTTVQCQKCGKSLEIQKLNSNGICPDCVKEVSNKGNNPISKLSPVKKAPTTNAANKPKLTPVNKVPTTNTANKFKPTIASNKPQIHIKPEQEKNYALWCLICGILTFFIPFVLVLTFDNASKAIKQAKSSNEAVSAKVWIGVTLSVIGILLFVFFMFLPVVLD